MSGKVRLPKSEKKEELKNFMKEIGFNLDVEGWVQFMEVNERMGSLSGGRVLQPMRAAT